MFAIVEIKKMCLFANALPVKCVICESRVFCNGYKTAKNSSSLNLTDLFCWLEGNKDEE